MTGIFKKDSYVFGSIIGIVTIAISLLLIYLTMSSLGKSDIETYFKIYLLAIIPNVLLFRYYLKVLVFEKTGKAILFVSFILLFAYFYYQFKH